MTKRKGEKTVMKVCVVQPYYSRDYGDAEKCFAQMTALLDQCGPETDLIVLPEYSDVPTDVPSKKEFDESVVRFNERILDKARETAVRCGALVFVNAAYQTTQGYRNTTYAIDRGGKIVGKYFKAHPAPSEVRGEDEHGNGLDVLYSYEKTEPYVLEIEGVRFGFMTCYDFYFYEAFAPLARQNVDVIIGCSHQRTDTHEALEIIGRFLAYNTNAYLIRSAVSLGEDSEVCGSSMVVSPKGEMLVDLKSRIGLGVCEIDVKNKYYKPAGYKGALKSHYEYIEEGRRPWNYRPGGSAICLPDDLMPYPRVCAHRGFSSVAPENTLPAYGAAVALGADEIEFDLWLTKDGKLVSCHDPTLERVSDGTGKIYEYSYEELLKFDFGAKSRAEFSGLKICLFEDILEKFACHTIMNIHVKTPDLPDPDNELMLKNLISAIRKYDCEKYVYIMSSSDAFLRLVGEKAPFLKRCTGENEGQLWKIVDRAIELKTDKVQLFVPYFDQEMIDKAHAHGIVCNVFFADTTEDAQKYLDMGVDTILTNDYNRIANFVRSRKPNRS